MAGGLTEEGRPQAGHGGRACLACGEGGGALWVCGDEGKVGRPHQT